VPFADAETNGPFDLSRVPDAIAEAPYTFGSKRRDPLPSPMHIVLGGTGRVGSALTHALLASDQPVTVVSHRPDARAEWEAEGAEVAVADIHDADALRDALARGSRAFLLNPPADPSTDTVAEERRTVHSILDAVRQANPDRIVALSTYGARPGNGQGDLNVLYELERGLDALSIPTAVVRGAYFMSNWDMALDPARAEGVLHSLYPADFALPMVAPQDLGRFAARLLSGPSARTGIVHVEGPERYTPTDVADAFAEALGRSVEVSVTPREAWEPSFRELGFSDEAAASYVAMTEATLNGDFPAPIERGETTIHDYVAALVTQADSDEGADG
jgi:uncharacterized protein YbjT (DUF2867 family)